MMVLQYQHLRKNMMPGRLMCLVLLQLFLIHTGFGQNIVPNGDFEEYLSLPSSYGEWYKCKNWSNTNGFEDFEYPYASPDYLHSEGGEEVQLPNTGFATIAPYSGKAIMGFVTVHEMANFREYLSIKFSAPMIKGMLYKVSFWISNGSDKHYGGCSSNHVGVQFSQLPLVQQKHEPLGGTPQLEIEGEIWATSWQYISFEYLADEAYEYFTIGNFYNDSVTSKTLQIDSSNASAYYFIDKVEVIPYPMARGLSKKMNMSN